MLNLLLLRHGIRLEWLGPLLSQSAEITRESMLIFSVSPNPLSEREGLDTVSDTLTLSLGYWVGRDREDRGWSLGWSLDQPYILTLGRGEVHCVKGVLTPLPNGSADPRPTLYPQP